MFKLDDSKLINNELRKGNIDIYMMNAYIFNILTK